MPTHSSLALALALLLAPACAQFEAERRTLPDDDPRVRAGAVGAGTLVLRTHHVSSRVGLVSLEDGAWHVLELDHAAAPHRGSFAGPDALGRYAYVVHSQAYTHVENTPTARVVDHALNPERGLYWRTKHDEPKGGVAKVLLGHSPVQVVVGSLDRAGARGLGAPARADDRADSRHAPSTERVVDERLPVELLEHFVALSPTQGKLAWCLFDFDADGAPQGLHVELLDLDDGARKTLPLGRVHLDLQDERGPGFVWLGDERHLLFLHDPMQRDVAGWFALDGDAEPALEARSLVTREDGIATPERALELAVLDTETGSVRELGPGPYAWPIGSGDQVLASDGLATWIVHATDGAITDRRAVPHDSPLRVPWIRARSSELGVVGALGPERVFAYDRAEGDAALPRQWCAAMNARPSDYGLATLAVDGTAPQRVLPLAIDGSARVVGASLPRELPPFLRAARRGDD